VNPGGNWVSLVIAGTSAKNATSHNKGRTTQCSCRRGTLRSACPLSASWSNFWGRVCRRDLSLVSYLTIFKAYLICLGGRLSATWHFLLCPRHTAAIQAWMTHDAVRPSRRERTSRPERERKEVYLHHQLTVYRRLGCTPPRPNPSCPKVPGDVNDDHQYEDHVPDIRIPCVFSRPQSRVRQRHDQDACVFMTWTANDILNVTR
jgi:hypothetical protein